MTVDPLAHDSLPRPVALAWGLIEVPRRGPKRVLTLEQIVEAATLLADEEGLAAVTMQRVAGQFEFTTMALYRYVATKSELHVLMLDSVLGQPAWTVPDGPWQGRLRYVAANLFDRFAQHPWVLDIDVPGNAWLMPGHLSAANAILFALSSLDLTHERQRELVALVFSTIRGAVDMNRTSAQMDVFSDSSAVRNLLTRIGTDPAYGSLARLITPGVPLDLTMTSGRVLEALVAAVERATAEH